MTIGSSDQLRSAAGVPFLPLGPGVTAVNPINQAWLQQAGWGYSGVPAGSTAVVAAVVIQHFVYRRRRRLRAKKLTV